METCWTVSVCTTVSISVVVSRCVAVRVSVAKDTFSMVDNCVSTCPNEL